MTVVSILLEERTRRHGGILGYAAVEAFAAAALSGEHGAGALDVLMELHVLLDGKRVGHRFYIEVVGADEGKSPVLLLQLLNHRANHLQCPFLATVLLAVGDDGHEHVVTVLNLGIDLRDTFADGIIEGCAAAGIVGSPTEVFRARGGGVVIVPGGMAAIESEEGDELHLVGELLLHLADHCGTVAHDLR